MMKAICPICEYEIPTENINVVTDVAKCQNCGNLTKLSSIVEKKEKKEKVEMVPPAGSKIIMEKGLHGEVKIIYPKKGLHKGLLPIFIFSIFWLGFIAVWTLFALMGSGVFALFSIPFWVIGIGMFLLPINAAFTVEVVTVNKRSLVIERKRLIKSSYFETEIKNILGIEVKDTSLLSRSAMKNLTALSKEKNTSSLSGIKSPTVTTDLGEESFFILATEKEKEWITSLLEFLVENLRR